MNESKATRYQRSRRRVRSVGAIAGGALLIALVATPASRGLAGWSSGVSGGHAGPLASALTIVTFVTCAVALWEAVALPAVLYLALSIDRRYTRADTTVEQVLGAEAQAAIMAWVGTLVVALVVSGSIAAAGAGWWLVGGGLMAVLMAAALRVAPALFVLIAGASPIVRPSLSARLDDLGLRARVPVAGIDEWRAGSAASAAMVAGVGSSRRIFVASHVLRDWSEDEIAVVVAHELAHHAHHDLWRTLALDFVVLTAGFWAADVAVAWCGPALGLSGPADLAALPFLALVAGIVWTLATPLRHGQSRRHERRADRFALDLTGDSDAFTAAIRRLGAVHLSEEQPSLLTRWLYHRHPSIAERLASAEAHVTARRSAEAQAAAR